MSRRDAVYARQSVEKKDSLSLSGQLDLCRRAAGESWRFIRTRATPEKTRIVLPSRS